MAAARIRLLTTNYWIDTASTVTASSAASGLPATYTQNFQRTAVWRSTAEANPWIKVDLGSSRSFSSVAIANFAVVSGTLASLKLQWSSDGSTGWTDIGVIGASDAESLVAAMFFGTLSKRYVRILATPTSGNIQIEIGFIHLGPYTEPSINITVPQDLQLPDPGIVTRAVDGQRTATARTLRMSGEWSFDNAPEADALALRTIQRALGVRVPHFVVLDSAVSWTAWMLFLNGSYKQTLADRPGRYHVRMGWEEA